MRRPTEPRLQRQLMTWLLGPLLALLVLDAGFSWWSSWRFANLAHDRSLNELARELALHVKEEPAGTLSLQLTPAAQRVLLEDAQDRIFWHLASQDGQQIGGDASLVRPGQHPTDRPQFYIARIGGEDVRVVSVTQAIEQPRRHSRVSVHVAETLNKRTALARDIMVATLLPQLLLILLATLAVYFGVTRGLRPLARLREAVSARSHARLDPLDLRGVPAEVHPLVQEFNALMERVAQSLKGHNRFIADAAHQLKTPISGLKAQIELALREPDPARLPGELAQLYVSTDRLSRLVKQLLELARNEPGAADVRLDPLDLRAFALEASMEWVPVALRAGVDLGFEAEEVTMIVMGEKGRLRELVNNLLDNAIRYSARNGRVTVSTLETIDGLELSVSDDSPRIPPAEREHIFERFHRILGSDADGSGLGLAIVSEIAALHGACIRLEDDTDGVGNRFVVVFPHASATT
jgi:two-component system sensor histidine kinase TctE